MQKMDMILENVPAPSVVIVYGKTKEEHDQKLNNLIKVAQTEGLCLTATNVR